MLFRSHRECPSSKRHSLIKSNPFHFEDKKTEDQRAEEQAEGMADTDQKQEGQMDTVNCVENGGVEDATEMVVVTEGVEEMKDEIFKTGEIEIEEVKENGVETDKEKEGDGPIIILYSCHGL